MDGDRKPIILKCFKTKKKFRTYVFNAEQYFDTIETCYKIFTKIKKALGTSMEVKSAKESDESTTKENNKKVTDNQNSGDENEDNLSNESVDNTDKLPATLNTAVVNENDSNKGQKRKKIKKKHKTPNYVSDPVFSFGGDQINKIIKFLIDGKYVTNDCIRV